QAFAIPGPVVVQAVIDPFEPPLPGKITTAQAWQFVKAVARGTEDRWALMKTVVENKIREVV
ncbi:MAG: pyruvate oxidase, partial [Nitrospira sp.]